MLVLSRELHERIVITNKKTGESVTICYDRRRDGSSRIWLAFDDDARNFDIDREEVYISKLAERDS